MLAALNKPAFDTISYLEWTAPGGQHYRWFKLHDSVIVSYANIQVRLNLQSQRGPVFKDGHGVSSINPTAEEQCKRAYKLFCNDSFWLIAPYKVRDPGTKRSLVSSDDGPALLVTYESGGVTPGDAYLWLLDENFRPKAWQIWADILPIGGLEFTWENWQPYRGAWISNEHSGPGPASLTIDFNHQ